MMMITKRFTVFFCGFLLVLTQVFAQQGATAIALDSQVVAIARNTKPDSITVKDFKQFVEMRTYQEALLRNDRNYKLSPEERRKALEEMGELYLLRQAAQQAADRGRIRNINERIRQEVSNGIRQAYASQGIDHTPTKEEIDEGVKRGGEDLKNTVLIQEYIKMEKKALFDAIKPPSDQEIQNFYNNAIKISFFQGGFFYPEAVGVRMLVVPFVNEEQKARARTTANNLASRIGRDANKFDAEFNATPQTIDVRNLGTAITKDAIPVYNDNMMRSRYGAKFIDDIFKLEQGRVSAVLEFPPAPVLQQPGGFCLIKVMAYNASETLSLAQARPQILRRARQEAEIVTLQKATQELIADIKKRGSIEIKDNIYNQIVW